MKEVFVSFLLFLSRISLFEYILKLFYKFIEKYFSKKLIEIEDIRSIYIKGSYATGSYVPALSDIDYIIISNSGLENVQIKMLFKKYKKFFPFISDFDIFTEKELKLLLRHGGNKYRNCQDWKLIYGEDLRNEEYAYYPLKFFIEQIHELYFYLEWITINLNKNIKNSTLYRRKVLERGLEKILACVFWIESSSRFSFNVKFSKQQTQMFNDLKDDVINNNSLHTLSKYINSVETISYFHELLPREFNWFERVEMNELLEDNNYLITVGNFEYIRGKVQNNSRQDRLILNDGLSDLFIKLGCFHFDHLFNFSINAKNRLCGSLMKIFAYTKIIEGKESNVYTGNLEEIIALDRDISQQIDLNSKQPYDLKNKTVFISVNWGSDKRRFWALEKAAEKLNFQSVKLPWFHFDMNFKDDFKKHPSQINHIKIKGYNSNEKLWQKECMYNFAAHYCFGAKNYIFSDADVYSEDLDWFKKMETLLNSGEYDFIHGFSKVSDTEDKEYSYDSWTKKYLQDDISFMAPGLVWGIPRKTFNILEYLPDVFPDGSNDGALLQELTNVKMGVTAKFDWYSTRIRTFKKEFKITYCDVDVIHCNHGISRDYINRVMLIDLVQVPLEQMYSKNSIGIYAWSENSEYQTALDLSNLYYSLDSTNFIETVDGLIEKEIIKIPNEMIFWSDFPHENYISLTNGVGFLYSTGPDKYKIVTSKYNKASEVKMRWGGYDLMDNEHLYVKFLVKKNATDFFDISVNYNWWRLAGSNNTYDQKFFKNMIEQPLAVCASSWEDHAITFIDIETTQKVPGATYEIAKIDEERINIFHSWNKLEEIEVNYGNLNLQKNSFDIPLGKCVLNKNGWFRIDVKIDEIEKIPLKITVVAGTRNIPVTTTRLFEDSTSEYLRILFHKNYYMNNIRLRVKLDIKKDIIFNKVKLKLSERRKI